MGAFELEAAGVSHFAYVRLQEPPRRVHVEIGSSIHLVKSYGAFVDRLKLVFASGFFEDSESEQVEAD